MCLELYVKEKERGENHIGLENLVCTQVVGGGGGGGGRTSRGYGRCLLKCTLFSLYSSFGVYTLSSTVAGGAFVVCITLSSAPWCFEHCGIGGWLQASGRWSVALKSRVLSYPGREKFVCRWCLPSVSTLCWWGSTVQLVCLLTVVPTFKMVKPDS